MFALSWNLKKILLGTCFVLGFALGLYQTLSQDGKVYVRRLAEETTGEDADEVEADFSFAENASDSDVVSIESRVEHLERLALLKNMEAVDSDSSLSNYEISTEDQKLMNASNVSNFPLIHFPKVWASSRRIHGAESCRGGTLKYCNGLMYRARSMCGGPNCVLITNPPGHRTREIFHIHAYHFNGRGAALKRQMMARVCRKRGWLSGGFPCAGRAKYFPGFPPVFSVAFGVSHGLRASITAWPGSCGGGTIVLVSYGCSIEHSISQR
eukprot:TRINITY_DN292_c2_g1_i1.p1 TRINITY_DN292_c2_g1~~TRINITY_DN292_c2_g1_i1.p1  ORF type:complete len:298 (+),score=40.31 TRINITY_DN292_c2_g1_i1:93-896(+)